MTTRHKNTPGLTQEESALLLRIIGHRAPVLQQVAMTAGTALLSARDCQALREVLVSEFCARGLGAGDEPNDYGRKIEDLIDSVSCRLPCEGNEDGK